DRADPVDRGRRLPGDRFAVSRAVLMTTNWAGALFIVALIAVLVLSYRPLGDYMARVYTGGKHLTVERWIYRATGVNPDVEQRWGTYLRSMLAFSAVSVLFLYLMLRVQG